MPLYAYRCNDCEHEFETRQRMSDDPLTDCPVCEGEIRRVINQVGIVFKGSGFYVTDNKGKNPAAVNGNGVNGNGANGNSGDGSASEGTTSATSETKSGDTPADSAPPPATAKSENKAAEATTA